MPYYLGLDLGGTRVRAALVDTEGACLWSREHALADLAPENERDRTVPFWQLSRLIAEGSAVESPAAIGVAATGPVDRATGIIDNPYTLPPQLNGNVVDTLSERHRVAVSLLNDADAAGLGEAWIGDGQDASSCAVVTIGTGIGFALVREGVIYHGAQGRHPEGGHQIVAPDGPRCACGLRGCLEALCSGPAIARQMSAAAPGPWTTAEVVAAAHAGHPAARRVLNRAGRALGAGLTNIVALHAPDVIVLNGGVALGWPEVAELGRKRISEGSIHCADEIDIKVSRLGEQAGAIGAARYAMEPTVISRREEAIRDGYR